MTAATQSQRPHATFLASFQYAHWGRSSGKLFVEFYWSAPGGGLAAGTPYRIELRFRKSRGRARRLSQTFTDPAAQAPRSGAGSRSGTPERARGRSVRVVARKGRLSLFFNRAAARDYRPGERIDFRSLFPLTWEGDLHEAAGWEITPGKIGPIECVDGGHAPHTGDICPRCMAVTNQSAGPITREG